MKERKEAMDQELSYTEKAFGKLKPLCITRYYDRYSNGDNYGAYEQMKRELSMIERRGSAPLILGVYEALTAVEAKPKMFCLKGTAGASVVLYILGLSEVNPVSIVPKLYPEFYFGIEWKNFFSIELWVSTKLYKRLVRYFDLYKGEAGVRCRHFVTGELAGVAIYDPQRQLGFDDKKALTFHFPLIPKLKKTLWKRVGSGKVFDTVNPQTFEEQVKCMAWIHDNGTWKKNAEELFKTGNVPFQDLIANREDVFEFMLQHGIGEETAFRIAEYIRRGRVNRRGWDPDMLDVLNKAGVPTWYLKSCEKIRYLWTRAHDISILKHKELWYSDH